MDIKEQENSWLRAKEREHRDNPYLAIVGPQGVGKTTLADYLRDHNGLQKIEENYSGLEHLLGEFNGLKRALFKDPHNQEMRKRAQDLAVELEIIFLGRSVGNVNVIEEGLKRGMVLQDTAEISNVIYVETYLREGLFRPNDADFYLKQLGIVREVMPMPDLLIGLKVSPPVLVDRVRKRDREFERDIPDSEFKIMAEISNALIEQIKASGWPVLEIDTDRFNYAHNGHHQTEVVSMVLGGLVR